MKMNILSKTILMAAVFSGSALLASYPDVMLTNNTPFPASGILQYAACGTDNWSLNPGETKWIGRGLCLLTRVAGGVDVYSAPADTGKYGITVMPPFKRYSIDEYHSSGTSYGDNFKINYAPTYNPDGTLKEHRFTAGRLAQ